MTIAGIHLKSLKPMCLCGNCLMVVDYSDERHQGIDKCACGGEFCGCQSCVDTIIDPVDGGLKRPESIAKLNARFSEYLRGDVCPF